MKKLLYSLFLACSMILVSSCELDLLDDPNAVTVSTADPNFLLNRIQVDLAAFANAVGTPTMRLTRIFNQFENTYETAYIPVSFDGIWTNAYANILNDIKLVKSIAQTRGLNRHAGIAKTIEAYVLLTMVDLFGNVPYSEALNPNILNPVVDQGSAVYSAAIQLLISAKDDFSGAAVGTPNDFYYGGNATSWTRFANTLLLKAYINQGSGTSISSLQAETGFAGFIGATENFMFRYGTSVNDPFTQHPRYQPQGGDVYQANFFMWHLTEAKKGANGFPGSPGDASSSPDPRANYYFYRQTNANPTDVNEIRCINEFIPAHYDAIGMIFCLPGVRGYWGRDHLDNQGIPPDGLRRTLWGIYPAGGVFDNNVNGAVGTTRQGSVGAGIQPIMMASYVDFMLAEAVTRLGVSGDARALMLSGVTKSLNFVRSWALSTNQNAVITAFESQDAYDLRRDTYLTNLGVEYDASTDRMNIIAREYWISLYGNGIEAYNLYRRTGRPVPMQPGLIANFGTFPRSFIYPSVHVNRNGQAQQKPSSERVFWDNNTDNIR